MNPKRRSPAFIVFCLLAFLVILSLACNQSASVPAQYVYWQAATEPATATPEPGGDVKNCPKDICYPEGVFTPECVGTPFPEYGGKLCKFEPFEAGPTPTPYFRHYQFYKKQPLNMIGGLVIQFEGADTTSYKGKNYHVMKFKAWNKSGEPISVLFPFSAEIREIKVGGSVKVGTWGADEDAPEVIQSYCAAHGCTPLLGDEDMTDIPAGASGMDWIAVVQAPAGQVENYLLGTDPFSSDQQSFIIFRDETAPDLGTGYQNEIDPNDLPYIAPFPTAAYYDAPGGGSSQAWSIYEDLPNKVPGDSTFDYNEFVNMNGSMLPLANAYMTQEYGCSNFGTPGTCAYPSGGGQCSDVTPKCKDWSTGQPTVGWHNGVDWGASLGTPIYAALPGKVTSVTGAECADVNFYDDTGQIVADCKASTYGYGFHITVTDINGYKHLYAHLSAISSAITVGADVKRGQVIAQVGNSGWSTGPHLHYTVYTPGGSNTNPFVYLQNAAVSDAPADDIGDENPNGIIPR